MITTDDMTSEARKQLTKDLENVTWIVARYNGITFDRVCAKLGFCYLQPSNSRKSGCVNPRGAMLLSAVKSDERYEVVPVHVSNRVHAEPPQIWLAGTRVDKTTKPSGRGQMRVWIDESFIQRKEPNVPTRLD